MVLWSLAASVKRWISLYGLNTSTAAVIRKDFVFRTSKVNGFPHDGCVDCQARATGDFLDLATARIYNWSVSAASPLSLLPLRLRM